MFKNTHKVFSNNYFNRHKFNGFTTSIGKKSSLRIGSYGGSLLLLLIAYFFICPPVHEDNSSAMTGTSVASDTTLSISITNPILSLDLTPTSTDGTFATSSSTTIAVTTNNITGYTIGIKASDSSDTSSLLVNSIEECEDTPTSSKCSLPSLSSSVSLSDYSSSDPTTTGTNLNNTWGYLPSYYNSVVNEDYLPAPSSSGDIINITTGPNAANTSNVKSTTDELIPDEYTLNLGARIDYTPYAGSYSNTFIITAVGNPVPYSVSYDTNIPAPVQDTATIYNFPTAQAGQVSSGDTVAIILRSNTPILKDSQTDEYIGYAFAGWCTEPTTVINDGTNKDYQECPASATLYQPGDNFGIDQTESNTQTLYAVWGYMTTINFDANAPLAEVTGEMSEQIIPGGKTEALKTAAFTRSGYYFMGWDADSSAFKPTYTNEANYTAASDQTADITLYAIWTDCPPNSICYDDNGASSPITMSNQSTSSNTTATLWPMNYKYDTNNDGYNDYGFAGWSEDKDAIAKLLDIDTTNNPTVYGPNQDIPTGDLSTYGIKLYAVWVPPATDKDGNILTFQTTNLLNIELTDTMNDTLANKPIKYVTALKDYRDNQVYAVAKLADGNYWMIENLRLESSATVGNNINDSSITNQSLAEGYSSDFVGLATAESNFSSYGANELYYTNDSNTMPRYNNANTISPIANMTTFNSGSNIYSLGNYYTWAASIADIGVYTDSNEHSTIQTSICPAGWGLPYGNTGNSGDNLGGTSGGFSYLDKQIGGSGIDQEGAEASNRWRSFPNNFVFSGYFFNTSASERSTTGYYWSNSSGGGILSFSLGIDNDYTFPGNNSSGKHYGFSVRCLIK